MDDSVRLKMQLFVFFQSSQMMRSAREGATFREMLGREVMMSHHSIDDEEGGH